MNSESWLESLFQSLRSQTDRHFEAIVLDNASTDDTARVCSNSSDLVKLVREKRNFGFAAGNNRAAAYAKGTHLFFLNPDTLLPPSTIASLYDAISKSPESILAPLQLHYDGSKELTSGLGVDIVGYPAAPRDKTDPFYADGAALVVPTFLFRKLNGFDERHFMFHEDLDLCWRARLLGYHVTPYRSVIVRHYSGGGNAGGAYKGGSYATTWFRRYHGEKNTIRNLLKNYSAVSLLIVLPIYLLQQLGEMLVMVAAGRKEFAHADFAAILWNIRQLGETLRVRKGIQSSRIVSDRQIFKNMYIGLRKFSGVLEYGLPVLAHRRKVH